MEDMVTIKAMDMTAMVQDMTTTGADMEIMAVTIIQDMAETTVNTIIVEKNLMSLKIHLKTNNFGLSSNCL